MSYYRGLPKKLRIGPYDIKIEITELNHEDGEQHIWGKWRDSKQLIQLTPEQPNAPFAVDTMMHEIIHAIFSIHHLDKEDDEERIVSSIASALTQVYRDNRALLAWISKRAR